jgi:hypothetical protein
LGSHSTVEAVLALLNFSTSQLLNFSTSQLLNFSTSPPAVSCSCLVLNKKGQKEAEKTLGLKLPLATIEATVTVKLHYLKVCSDCNRLKKIKKNMS